MTEFIRDTCESPTCAAPIIWAVTKNAKRMPVDFEPSKDGNVALEDRGTGVPFARVLTRRPAIRPQKPTHEPLRHMPGRQEVPQAGSVMKPPVTYYGGKLSIAEQIVACLPEHLHYVEPFAGSLAVLLAKPPSSMETVNDLDGRLMTFWRVLRDQPEELHRLAMLTPHSRAEHRAARAVADTELETARRVWILLTQGRSGTLRPTGWRYYVKPRGSSSSMPTYLEAYRNRMPAAAERLMAVSLEARPALDVIAQYGQHAEVLLYVDPPYLGSTRSGTNYLHEMQRPEQHAELAEALWACAAAVVLSGYDSPLYRELYHGWHRHEIVTGTGQGGTYKPMTEVLWANRPMPAQLELFTAAVAGHG